MTNEAIYSLLAAGSYWDIRKGAFNQILKIDTDNDAPLPSGWKVLTQFDKPGSGSNAISGFSARVYQNTSTGEVANSYGGTEFGTTAAQGGGAGAQSLKNSVN